MQTVALADLPQHLGGNPGSNAVGRNIAGHYRTGGDEFEVIVEGRDVSLLPSLLHYFADELSHSWDETLPSDGVSYGWAEASFNSDSPLTTEALADLRETADQSLYRNKHDNKSA